MGPGFFEDERFCDILRHRDDLLKQRRYHLYLQSEETIDYDLLERIVDLDQQANPTEEEADRQERERAREH